MTDNIYDFAVAQRKPESVFKDDYEENQDDVEQLYTAP